VTIRTMRQTVLLPAPPDVVYRALSNSIRSEVPASQVTRHASGWPAFDLEPLRRHLEGRSAK